VTDPTLWKCHGFGCVSKKMRSGSGAGIWCDGSPNQCLHLWRPSFDWI